MLLLWEAVNWRLALRCVAPAGRIASVPADRADEPREQSRRHLPGGRMRSSKRDKQIDPARRGAYNLQCD